MEIEDLKSKSFKAKYCNKGFKTQLMKALRANNAEPNAMEKIRG